MHSAGAPLPSQTLLLNMREQDQHHLYRITAMDERVCLQPRLQRWLEQV